MTSRGPQRGLELIFVPDLWRIFCILFYESNEFKSIVMVNVFVLFSGDFNLNLEESINNERGLSQSCSKQSFMMVSVTGNSVEVRDTFALPYLPLFEVSSS